MKKLIPALCMLLVAATLLGTSTYAWFSMNTQVTASGMSVTASAPKSLLISTSEDTGFGNTVSLTSMTTVAGTIVPSHYNEKMLFAKLNNSGTALVDQAGDTYGVAKTEMDAFIAGSDATFPTGKTYIAQTEEDYFKDDIYLKYEGENGTANITLSVAFATENTDPVKTAMHVVVVNSEGTVVLDYDMSEAGTAKDISGAVLTANEAATKYTVYYFLDGEDAECKNSNITANNTIGVTLTFAIKQ